MIYARNKQVENTSLRDVTEWQPPYIVIHCQPKSTIQNFLHCCVCLLKLALHSHKDICHFLTVVGTLKSWCLSSRSDMSLRDDIHQLRNIFTQHHINCKVWFCHSTHANTAENLWDTNLHPEYSAGLIYSWSNLWHKRALYTNWLATKLHSFKTMLHQNRSRQK